MKNLFLLTAILALFSCSGKEEKPIIIPPNFAEMPDVNNPEKNPQAQQNNDEEVARLKKLLLESQE